MKKILFTVFLLIGQILPFYGYGQNSIKMNEYTKKTEKPNAIFFAPPNLFDFVNPNFQIGYERFVAEKWSLQLEGGIIINHSIEGSLVDLFNGVDNCPYTNKGFRVKGSVKYFMLEKIKGKLKMYVSPELFYLKNKSGIARDFFVSEPDFEYSTPLGLSSRYTLFFYNDERKMGINFKVGFKFFVGKSFFAEPHIGLGFAYRDVIHTYIEEPIDVGEPCFYFRLSQIFGDIHTKKENPNDKLLSQDIGLIFNNAVTNKWVPTFPLNIKIGFRF